MTIGIYDFDVLVKSFPSYPEWFLNTAFPNPNDWSFLSLSRQPLIRQSNLSHTIIWSQDDELIDELQGLDMKRALESAGISISYITESMGTHDLMMRSPMLLDLLKDIIVKYY